MKYDHLSIRYGELGLKGKNINQFINRLQRNVQKVLAPFPKVRVTRSSGRLFAVLNGQEPKPVVEACKKVFGIYSMSLAMKVENNEESIKAGALKALQQAEQAKTFKVNVRRANKQFPISSIEMNQRLGGHLLRNTADITVDVHQPDVE